MRPAKRRATGPPEGFVGPVSEDALLGKCWYSRAGGPEVKIMSLIAGDGHMDAFASWVRDGRRRTRKKCGVTQEELEAVVAGIAARLPEVSFEVLDLRPFKTREEQQAEMRRLGHELRVITRPSREPRGPAGEAP